jgi:hypothetical protein
VRKKGDESYSFAVQRCDPLDSKIISPLVSEVKLYPEVEAGPDRAQERKVRSSSTPHKVYRDFRTNPTMLLLLICAAI